MHSMLNGCSGITVPSAPLSSRLVTFADATDFGPVELFVIREGDDNILPIVDDEDALCVGVSYKALNHGEDSSKVLVLHHKLSVEHRHLPL